MKKETILSILAIILVAIILAVILVWRSNQNTNPVISTTNSSSSSPVSMNSASSTATSSLALPVAYQNTLYGFNYSLPADWQGFSIVTSTWSGYASSSGMIMEIGPEILIRNPNWTASDHYEDIPILVFKLDQWTLYQAQNFSISAAPIPATELGQNNKYVFALPPRWDYDYSTGYQEADAIVSENPLHPFTIQ